MPSKDVHVSAAVANQRTINYLREDCDNHLSWVVAVAFYKALHVVEAVLDADANSPIKDTDSHFERHKILRRTPRYQQLWKMYSPLYQASMVARYLREDGSAPTFKSFCDYLTREDVEKKLLGHYLVQLEKSAAKLIKESDSIFSNPSKA